MFSVRDLWIVRMEVRSSERVIVGGGVSGSLIVIDVLVDMLAVE